MNSLKPEIKPSHKILMLISQIERLAGRRELRSQVAETRSILSDLLQKTYLSTLCLDQTTPAQLTHPIISYFKTSPRISLNLGNILSDDSLKQSQACKDCFTHEFNFCEQEIIKVYCKLANVDFEEVEEQDIFRKTITSFLTHENQRVFTAVSPFLVKKRFYELVEWVSDELYLGEIHPIIVIATYHLLFLQLQPFQTANHRTALVTTWHLLRHSGFSFVRESDLFGIFLKDEKEYYAALKQSERSVFTDWTTMNAWIEFFSSKLFECATNCFEQDQTIADFNALSATQKRILEIIKREGVVSRERVVSETGISSSTIKYNLSQLAERGHLRREGQGRATNYRLF